VVNEIERKLRQNLHELKTSYSNSGFVTTPYEHLFEKEQSKVAERIITDGEPKSLNQSMSEGFKLRGEIEGKFPLTLDRDLDNLIRLRDRQRDEYEAQIENLRSKVIEKNRAIAALKAQIIHYKSHQH
jgi:hypothetical protein